MKIKRKECCGRWEYNQCNCKNTRKIKIEIIPQDYCDHCNELKTKSDLIFNQFLFVNECKKCYRGYS